MYYNSVTEYFSKLQNRSLLFFLSNVLLLSVLLYFMVMKILTPVMPDDPGFLIALGICLFSFAEAFASLYLTHVMLSKVRLLQSLGERLDKYASVNLIRLAFFSSGSLMLILAFYLSGYAWIVVAYVLHLFFSVWFWPMRSRVCAELKLKPSEQEVMYGR
jgi:hypothetical protein